MKNIGVLIPNLASEYSSRILNGITSFYKDKDVRLIITHTDFPHDSRDLYSYQCWTSTAYLNTSELDAIIIVTGEYTSEISIPKLSQALTSFGKIPVISIGQELFLPKNHFTQVDCKTAYKNAISHLYQKHNCKKIAFLSANQTSSEEAIERFEAYKMGLYANNLDFDISLVIDGNFTDECAYKEIKQRYRSKKDLDCDAILCANDTSACGCIKAFKELGIAVPEDVKVFGYDNMFAATCFEPKLSTMEQDLYLQGKLAAELALNVLLDKNQKQQRVIQTPVKTVFRQSCGCISADNRENIYLDETGNICTENRVSKTEINVNDDFVNYFSETRDLYSLFDIIKADNTLEKLYFTLPDLMNKAAITQLEVCLFDNPIKLQQKDDFVLPKDMHLVMLIDEENHIRNFSPDMHFNAYKKIFHENYFSFTTGNYFLQPVFSAEHNYGYILYKLKSNNYAFYCIFMRIINSAITQAFQYTAYTKENLKLTEENIRLSKDGLEFTNNNQIDAMTKLPNHHGFQNICQQQINLAVSNGETGMITFADLDNLKYINSNYGKTLGDITLKAMVTVLSKTFRANDIIGRINGDELAILSIGLSYDNIPKIKNRIEELCIQISKEKNFPFLLSISIGCAEFSLGNKKLKNLLNEAEKNMFFEKKRNRQEKHSFVLMNELNEKASSKKGFIEKNTLSDSDSEKIETLEEAVEDARINDNLVEMEEQQNLEELEELEEVLDTEK